MSQRSGNKKKGSILKCNAVSFHKKPKRDKDRKGAELLLKFETASGSWEVKKAFEDVWKFCQDVCKEHKKNMGKVMKNEAKTRDEYLKGGKTDNAFKQIREVFNAVGKNKKILQNDSKIAPFVGAKRGNAADIKNAKTIKRKQQSVGNVSMLASLDGGGAPTNDNANPPPASPDTDTGSAMDAPDNVSAAPSRSAPTDHQLMERHLKEIDTLKREHMRQMHALKKENDNLNDNLRTMKESIEASNEVRQELEEKVMRYEQELGHDQLDNDIAKIFADEFKKDSENLTERYFQQSKDLKKRNAELENQVMELTKENGVLTTKLSRAAFVAEELGTEIAERNDKDRFQQLEQDYRDVEAELDEVTAIKERYEKEMATTANVLQELELENAKMRPLYEDHPKLVEKNAQERNEHAQVLAKLHELQEERDAFEDKYKTIEKKLADSVPKDQYKSAQERHKEDMKKLQATNSTLEHEKGEAVKEMEKFKEQSVKNKIEIGQLKAENERLEKGGGRDINLEISLDLENDFSIFQRDEFDFSSNLSRDQLLLWAEHVKVLIKEINEELCAEINGLAQRNSILENYIEAKGLPFPEDDNEFCQNQTEIQQILSINDLPHPLPSMSFMEDLDSYNPTKQQLKNYIDLMFAEWRDDQMYSNHMLLDTREDAELLGELEQNDNVQEAVQKPDVPGTPPADPRDEEIVNLKKKKDELYLEIEAAKEKEAETNKKIEGMNEMIEQLTKQIRVEQLKHKRPKSPSHDHGSFRDMPGIDEEASVDLKDSESKPDPNIDEKGNNNGEMNSEEIQQLLNRLQDTEQYVKDLQDERRQHDFEVEQQRMAMERQYKLEIQGLNLDLSEERNKCEDLERQIETDDLNLVASEFREELWVARNDNKELRKAHLGEINELEMDRDELLREINLLRIKTERSDLDTDERVLRMQNELDIKEKELQHFSEAATDLARITDDLERMQAHCEELEKSYRDLEKKGEAQKQDMEQEVQMLENDKRKLTVRLKTAEQDILALRNGQIDPESIITRTELVKMTDEMNDLRAKKAEAVKSKMSLLRTSSLEIERMRDEIRLLVGDRKVSLRDFNPGRYDSSSQFINNPNRLSIRTVSSLGSAIPLHSATHQEILSGDGRDSYMASAWTYTLGMLSSIGAVFHSADTADAEERHIRSPRRYNNGSYRDRYDDYDMEPYDVEDEYADSRQSSMSPQPRYVDDNVQYDRHVRSMSHQSRHHSGSVPYGRSSGHQKKHSRHLSRSKRRSRMSSMGGLVDRRPQHYNDQPSMAGSYANNFDGHHARNLSAGAFRAKRNKRAPSAANMPHQRKISKHRTNSNMSMSSLRRGVHRQKQPSKQEILLDSTDNVVVRDSMAEIFKAFDDFEQERNTDDPIGRGSQDLPIVSSGLTANALNRFSLDDIPSEESPPRPSDAPRKHGRVSSNYSNDYMRKPRTIEQERGDIGTLDQNGDDLLSGLQEDFWNIGRENYDAGVGDRYSDDERAAVNNLNL